jgi:CubicO group peptidase (beta-lactamase class C family)
MKTGGLSRARLDRLRKSMTGYVERGEVPGIVTLVSRHGEVHIDAVGNKSLDGPEQVARDTIFRLASMSKPITAAATMILAEEGKLRLSDAVEKWLPELADRKVLLRIDAPLDCASTRRSTRRCPRTVRSRCATCSPSPWASE